MAQDGRVQNLIAWWVIGLVGLVDVVWFLLSDYEISIFGFSRALLGVVAVRALLFFYKAIRHDERIVAALSGVILLIGFSAAAAPLSYLLAGLGFPLWDGALRHWDMALGLDWRSYLAWT
ncbi:MAG: hypothetical protein ACJ8B9_09705, partial [Microvirga sp.]